ncbi:MAG: hypothetical protein AB7H93_17460 [Vicinamibacterales bacterium]
MIRRVALAVLTAALPPGLALAQPAAPPQTQEDDYTRYELLAPGTGQFRILYEVTATRAGAPFFFNAIRKGSVATDERVTDAATGQPLTWEVVSGAQARAEGHPLADLDTEWIKVTLARPVPVGGEARVVIDKTYKDDKSYFRRGDLLVFDRPLGIRRNAVVLPAGYRLVSCNVPSQVLATPDGRVMIAFMHPGPAAAPLVMTAAPGLAPFRPAWPTRARGASWTAAASPADPLADRAHQDREAIYRLQAPASGTWELEHDFTEARAGARHHLEVLGGGGSGVPVVRNLDTGETLTTEVVAGAELAARAIDVGRSVGDREPVMLTAFPQVTAGRSVRLRVRRTVTDRTAYGLDGDELLFEQTADRPRQTVLLPAGWTVVASAVPVVVDETADGRQRLVYENPRPDALRLLIRARRR